MIDIANPTLTDALYLGFGIGVLGGLGVGFVLAFFALLWIHSGHLRRDGAAALMCRKH